MRIFFFLEKVEGTQKTVMNNRYMSKESPGILDIFQEGLRRNSARLPHDPQKKYAYVEHPNEGWRVYLRSAVFIHEEGVPYNPRRFIVVKKTGSRMTSAVWEPPKGQMEGKDLTGISGRNKSILEVLKENARRETAEESFLEDLHGLEHTGLVFQGQESSYPPNHFFQYHIFRATVNLMALRHSYHIFDWIQSHKAEFSKWKRDMREKDAIEWFDPKKTRLNPRWCPSIVALYLGFRPALDGAKTY